MAASQPRSPALAAIEPLDDAACRAEFGAITEMLTRHEPRGNEGRVRATLTRMSDAEAHAVAARIFATLAAVIGVALLPQALRT